MKNNKGNHSHLWCPIAAYIEELTKSTPETAVYHYTSSVGALGILESGKMWFTERAHLNDPSEVSHGIGTARDILWRKGKKKQADGLAERAEKVFDEFLFFSASFSLDPDDACQWKRYGDEGKGAVLSFKTAAPSAFTNPKKYIDQLVGGNPTVVICPMSYNMIKLQQVISSIIEIWDGKNYDELSDHVFMISSMFKHPAWESEKEFRFFVHQNKCEISKSKIFKTKTRDGLCVRYLDLPVQNWDLSGDFPSINRITLGPAVSCEMENKLYDLIKNFSRIQIQQSGISYRSA